MYLEKRQIHQTTVLDCYGRFDEDDHDPFMKVFETLHSEGCNHLIINLTSVYQLDAKVIHLLRFAHEYFTTSSRQLTLVCPLTAARRELDLAEIPSLIPTYVSVYDSIHRRDATVNKPALKAVFQNSGSPESGQALLQTGEHETEKEGPDLETAGVGQDGTQPEWCSSTTG